MTSASVPEPADLILGVLIATAIIAGAFFAAPWWLPALPLLAVACLASFRSTESNLLWFAASLALAIPSNVLPVRLSVADLFILPVIVREVNSWRRGFVTLRSTLTRPVIFLLAAAAIATFVGYLRIGRFTGWMLGNKDAGLLFLVMGCLVLVRFANSVERIRRLAVWFVYGVSATNIVALVAAPMAWAGIENGVYPGRLYGLIGNPNANGGLLIAAGMIEFALLAAAPTYGRRGALRYANLCCLGLGLGLTLSRSSWLALAVASAVLLVLLFMNRALQVRQRLVYTMMLAAWFVLPAGFVSGILVANALAGVSLSPERRAAELRTQFGDESELGAATPVTRGPASQPAAGPAPVAPSPTAAAPTGSEVPSTSARQLEVAPPPPNLDTLMMNSRGLTDRLVIVVRAWDAYTADLTSIAFGIGLGTFYATSVATIGLPLTIHNTFAWFLIELGPLGFIAVLWLWAQTTRNLQLAAARDDDGRFLAYGALAAFAGLTVFSVFNEGFYQRQLWLVIAVADQLRVSVLSSRAPADVVGPAHVGVARPA